MSTQKIPNSQKQIIQSNVGDYRGNLYKTFNCDLDSSLGTIKPSRKLDDVFSSATLGDDIPTALQIHDGQFYLSTNRGGYDCSVNSDPTVSSNWQAISTWFSEDLGFETDMTSFAGLLLVSLGTDIMSWDGTSKDDNWWTTVALGTALTADKIHLLEVLRTGNDTLFITDGNRIRYYNSVAGGTIITLDTLMTARALTPSLDRMWVGTYTEVENKAYVYEIRVGDAAALQAYEIDGRAALAMFTYNNTPFVITEFGFIQAFNGAGFVTVAQFPWANDSDVMVGAKPGLVQDSVTNTAIHPKGVKVKGKYAYIYVNTDSDFTTNLLSARAASGVWVLDLETYSLTHRYALNASNTTYGTHKVNRSGPLLITNTPNTRILLGTQVGENSNLWAENDETPQGYFVTTRHEAESAADVFNEVIIKADKLDQNDFITVKSKDTQYSNLPLQVNNVVWLTENQFNTTASLPNVEIGDEVEVVAGEHAGQICTITDITGTNTKTVTVDTDFATLNEVSDVYFDNWRVVGQMTAGDAEFKQLGGASGANAFRQYKVIMNGAVTVREIISNSNNKNAK